MSAAVARKKLHPLPDQKRRDTPLAIRANVVAWAAPQAVIEIGVALALVVTAAALVVLPAACICAGAVGWAFLLAIR